MSEIAIVEAFKDLPDPRRKEGKRHQQTLCLALLEKKIANLAKSGNV